MHGNVLLWSFAFEIENVAKVIKHAIVVVTKHFNGINGKSRSPQFTLAKPNAIRTAILVYNLVAGKQLARDGATNRKRLLRPIDNMWELLEVDFD